MDSNVRMIELTLQDLNASSSDITASALISSDGLPIATALPHDVIADRVGGMTAALLALGNRATRELRCGTMSQVTVQGDDGLVQASPESLLILTAKHEAKLGLILLSARQAVKQMSEWIEE